jgi:hypothetical protein
MGFRVWRMTPVGMMSVPHTHPDIEVNFLFSGRFSYLHGGTVVTIEPGRFTVMWGGVPHQTIAPGIVDEGIWITLPLGWFLQWRLPNELSDRLLRGEIVAGPPEPGDRPLLERWLADNRQRRPRAGARAAAGDGGALSTGSRSGCPPRAPAAPPARAAPGRSRASPASSPSTTASRSRCRPSPTMRSSTRKYLMRVFKKQCGASVWEYLTRLRVSHASACSSRPT